MEKFFQNPKTDSIDELLNYIDSLHQKVNKNVDVDLSRVNGKMDFKYKSELEKSNIPVSSQNEEDVLNDMSKLFNGAVRWNHDKTMINITPPPTILSVATSTYINLYNPNFAQDQVTGGLAKAELLVIKYLSDLIGWDWKKSLGIFTFGGKSTNMYGVKVGLNKSYLTNRKKGVKNDVFTVSSIQGHPCHTEVCDWLGIGSDNSLKLPVDSEGRIDIFKAEKIISENIELGKKLACITVNCGTTIQMTIDPIDEIVQMRDRIVKKYNLDYIPHIHADAVIGWIWLMFKNYDFKQNKLNISSKVLDNIKYMLNESKSLKYVDSLGVDFHKSGFTPYVSSLFMVKESKDLYSLGKGDNISLEDLEYGNYSPFQYSLELSRSGSGPITALTNLKLLGYEGYQNILYKLMEASFYTKEKLDSLEEYEVINTDTKGFVTIFMIRPPKSKILYDDISTFNKNDAQKIADYNYKFYLFILHKQNKGECSIAMDYTSGYDNTKKGISIGVFKIYPTSPYTNRESIDEFISELNDLKKYFDNNFERLNLKDVLYRPKAFVFR